jgi:hypothetical protein
LTHTVWKSRGRVHEVFAKFWEEGYIGLWKLGVGVGGYTFWGFNCIFIYKFRVQNRNAVIFQNFKLFFSGQTEVVIWRQGRPNKKGWTKSKKLFWQTIGPLGHTWDNQEMSRITKILWTIIFFSNILQLNRKQF